jgi:hypothetical protein
VKRRRLDREITEIARQQGVTLHFVHGANHDKWYVNGVMIPIPRHREIGERLAMTIIEQVREAAR